MKYKVWILATFLAGTYGLPTVTTEDSPLNQYPGSWRIIGGTPAHLVPYMVALTNGSLVRTFVCGGSLVSTRTILTAAHCIDSVFSEGSLSRSLLATVGTNQWNVSAENYRIAKNITHPDYMKAIIKNDIGLLITVDNVKLSNSVRTVPLHFDFIGPNVEARITGWGRITELGAPSSILQQLTTKTIDGERCVAEVAEASGKLNIFDISRVQPEIQLCTFHSKHHGNCKGDSGSPLVLADHELQIGIVSWGLPCALGAPDMYVRISAYKDWLQSNIN